MKSQEQIPVALYLNREISDGDWIRVGALTRLVVEERKLACETAGISPERACRAGCPERRNAPARVSEHLLKTNALADACRHFTGTRVPEMPGYRRIAKTSGAESFAPIVNEANSMPPNAKRPRSSQNR
jgi:hypothetical protein